MPCQWRGDVERLSVSNSPLLICAQTLSKLQLFLCCQPNDKLEEAVRDVINMELGFCVQDWELQETRRNRSSSHNEKNFCPHSDSVQSKSHKKCLCRSKRTALYIGSLTCSGSQHPILNTSFKIDTWWHVTFQELSSPIMYVCVCVKNVCVFVSRLCCKVRTRIPI